MMRMLLSVVALIAALATTRMSEPTSILLLGVVVLSALMWRSRRPPANPVYSRLATQSINCRPAKRPVS